MTFCRIVAAAAALMKAASSVNPWLALAHKTLESAGSEYHDTLQSHNVLCVPSNPKSDLPLDADDAVMKAASSVNPWLALARKTLDSAGSEYHDTLQSHNVLYVPC